MDTKYGKFQMESYMQKEVTNWVTLEDEKHAAKVEEKYNKLMVYTYIRCCDNRRCGELAEDLSNDYALG